MTTLTIAGINYEVIQRTTPDQAAPHTARMMRRSGAVASYLLRRLKGERLYEVTEFSRDGKQVFGNVFVVA